MQVRMPADATQAEVDAAAHAALVEYLEEHGLSVSDDSIQVTATGHAVPACQVCGDPCPPEWRQQWGGELVCSSECYELAGGA
jgi:hypothetical protein